MSSGPISNDSIHNALQRAKQLSAVNTITNGQKRSLGQDDLNFPPIKRTNNATSDMAGMGMGGSISDTLVEIFQVPENAVGLVIGRGGEQIGLIQQQTGCRVQMAADPNNTGSRPCTLQGPKHCIDKARQMINEVLERNRAGNTGLVGGGGGGNPIGGGAIGGHQNGSGGNYITTELMIPGPKCGLIIGKNGETIKSLQETIGVKMLLIQDNQTVSSGPKPLRLSGYPDKVEQAKRVVEQLINSNEGHDGSQGMRSSGPRSVGEVIVPRSSVGIIIGKGGETIKRLANESGAKIQFKPDEDPNAPDRCAVIQGSPEQINRATQMISELVTRSAQAGGPTETFYMHVPANKTGLVIGKSGDTIKQICGETAAHVELSRDPPPNANEKVFVIKGTPYQIHHVQHIIRIKVGDIAPGTPVPPFHGAITGTQLPTAGGAVAPNPYGPASHQFGAPDQFGANPAAQWQQNVSGQEAWAQYYNQQQQAGAQPGFANPAIANVAPQPHYQTVPSAVGQIHPHQTHNPAQPQQHQLHQAANAQAQQPQAGVASNVGGGAPIINPATGQPDYSAQWAEYYRTMGMHEQANMIEVNMRQQQQQTQQQMGVPQQQQPQQGVPQGAGGGRYYNA